MSFDRLLPAGLRWPGAAALHFGGGKLTWGELRQATLEQAEELCAAGAVPGDRIAVEVGEPRATAIALLAAIEASCLALPLSTELGAAERAHRLSSSGCRLVVRGDQIRRGPEPGLPSPWCGLLVFTSGTTGTSRGVVLPLDALLASAWGVVRAVELSRGDRWLNPLPLSHVGGFSVLVRCGLVGATALLAAPFEVEATADELEQGHATHASFVGRMLDRLLARRPTLQARSLRHALVGGGATSPDLLQRARAHGIPAVSTYGLTEAGSTVTLQRPDEAVGEAGDAGWPLAGRRVRIGPGGDVQVAGPMLMAGYWGAPQPPEWFSTGDLGRLEPDGRLVVLDRRSDLVVTGGENVYPVQVEAVLGVHPGLVEVAVVGLPHPSWGQELIAVVRWRDVEDLPGLEELARERLSPWERPRGWLVHDAPFPRNELGKLQRDELRRSIQDRDKAPNSTT